MRRPDCRGFTLLELLISITLVSVIVVILSMSVRTALRAYIKGREANRETVTVSAIRGLLGRQLRMAVRPGTSSLGKYFRFRGENDQLIFTTTHAPMGSRAGGIFLVAYQFQDRDNTLLYAQRIITEPDERKADPPGAVSPEQIKKMREDGWDVSLVPGLESVEFSYLDRDKELDLDAIDNWPSSWIKDARLPQAVGLVLRYKDENSGLEHESRLFFEIPAWKTARRRQLFGP